MAKENRRNWFGSGKDGPNGTPSTMNENDAKPPLERTKGRLFLAVAPSLDDLIRAGNIPADQCPRRYCWWWQSLTFDWEMTPMEGCTFQASSKPLSMKNAEVPCRRCDSSSTVDHYEPREPHLLEDGFAVPRWYSDNRRPNGEISYDLVMDDDMGFVEGSYRIEGCEWCVYIISKRPIETPSWKGGMWESGVSGIVVHVPLEMRLNSERVENLLLDILGLGKWEQVRGPDSMQLR
jgi:hypothetical protein